MCYEPDPLAPVVELIAGRLEREAEPRLGAKIEDDLMRGAWSGAGDRTGEAAFDWTMKMAAEDSLYLRMTPNDLGETGAVGEPGLIHPADSGQKWRMMHQDQSGPILRPREDAIEPPQPLRAQGPAALARHQRIEPDDAQRVILDRVVEESLPRQVPVPDKRLPHRFACIM